LYYGSYLQLDKVSRGSSRAATRGSLPPAWRKTTRAAAAAFSLTTPCTPRPPRTPPAWLRVQLLTAQSPKSREAGDEAHEEMLFITTHQVYELLFKQVLHELNSITAIFAAVVRVRRSRFCAALRACSHASNRGCNGSSHARQSLAAGEPDGAALATPCHVGLLDRRVCGSGR